MSQNKYQQSGARDLKCRELKGEQHPVPTPELGQGESLYGVELRPIRRNPRRQGPLGLREKLRETAEPSGAGPGAEGAAAGRQVPEETGFPSYDRAAGH